MYVYLDESGNTGIHVFDDGQKNFYLLALKWVYFVGPLSGEFKVDSFTCYAALWVHPRGGTPSGVGPL